MPQIQTRAKPVELKMDIPTNYTFETEKGLKTKIRSNKKLNGLIKIKIQKERK